MRAFLFCVLNCECTVNALTQLNAAFQAFLSLRGEAPLVTVAFEYADGSRSPGPHHTPNTAAADCSYGSDLGSMGGDGSHGAGAAGGAGGEAAALEERRRRSSEAGPAPPSPSRRSADGEQTGVLRPLLY